MFLVDTNVLLDLAVEDAAWATWSADTLSNALDVGEIGINPLIYAELSVAYSDAETLDSRLDQLGVRRLPLPYQAGFLAGRAFLKYRRAGGAKTAPLPDFYIGAHAMVAGLTVLTRDPTPFRTYFPRVELIAP